MIQTFNNVTWYYPSKNSFKIFICRSKKTKTSEKDLRRTKNNLENMKKITTTTTTTTTLKETQTFSTWQTESCKYCIISGGNTKTEKTQFNDQNVVTSFCRFLCLLVLVLLSSFSMAEFFQCLDTILYGITENFKRHKWSFVP